ncbi:hypothetical protein TorRG33x02_155520 [Trema orientale]|uniref:Uncharacterized protein n=1 Tax=Trema orientale TaxID=63057 RepID=A0A2P5ESY3_TREOI|nr:hypothetical protein TorRG33x02_155520 [Trema orientale]
MEKGPDKEQFSTEVAQLDEALSLLDSSLSHIKWRLKPSARRRLHIDVLALCTGMRPVVMVDYGGKMPELQERLCALLKLCQKESSIFEHLRVMIIEDMIYLVHIRGLAEHAQSSLKSESQLLFVDIEQDPPKMIMPEKNPLGIQFISVQKRFSVLFPLEGTKNDFLSCPRTNEMVDAKSPVNDLITSQSSDFIDLSSCLQDTQVTLPTLNGWLLGYPVVYAFGKEHISDAIRNLSTKSLHIFKISVSRNSLSTKESQLEELLSFSVPYSLSMGGSNEHWAKAHWTHMQMKLERCKQAWRSLQLDVNECVPQAIVL